MQERAHAASQVAGPNDFIGQVGATLDKIALEDKKPVHRLRALWALHVTAALNYDRVVELLKDKAAPVRAWAIQLALEDREKNMISVDQLAELAENDPPPLMRLYLASALQRLDYGDRERLLEHLVAMKDSDDPNLPLLYWYALEPLAGNVDHRKNALKIAAASPIPILLPYTMRRIASDTTPDALDLVLTRIADGDDPRNLMVLAEIQNGLKGRPQVKMPATAGGTTHGQQEHRGPHPRDRAGGDLRRHQRVQEDA